MPSSQNHDAPNDSPNPALMMRRRRLTVLACAGIVVAAMLVLVIFNIDARPEQPAKPPPVISDIEGPSQLTDSEMKGGVLTETVRPQVIGAERAWITFMGPDGKPEKQYRCQSLEPLPDGWSKMTNPEFEAFVSRDRVVTMTSDSAMIYMPSRQPESGTLSGNVIIRSFDVEPGESLNSTSSPTLEIRTQQASFDNTRGEIRCDGELLIETTSAKVDGSGLRLLFNEIARRAEWMKLDRGAVRISNAAASAQQATPDPVAALEPKPARDKPRSPRNSAQATQPVTAQPQFYRLTFNQNVKVEQESTGWTAQGDELAVIFSLQGNSLDNSLSMRFPDGFSTSSLAASLPSFSSGSPHVWISALAIAAAPADSSQRLFEERADDIVITCDAGISMTPLINAAEKPDSVDDARFELIGSPLQLRNSTERFEVTCRSLVYQSLQRRFTLSSDPTHQLVLASPQMTVSADRLWINQVESKGALEGSGWMTLHDEAAPAPEDRTDDVRITWADRVELEFERSTGEAKQQSDLKLQNATFRNSVRVSNPDIELTSDALTASFQSAETRAQAGQRTIQSVLATGHVHAQSIADNGQLECQSLNVDFGQSAGRTVPLALLAQGNVFATDPKHQTIWAQRLKTTFDANAQAAEASSSQLSGGARVRLLTAHDDVQILLADGARAFGDQLEADNAQRTVILTGADVLIVSENSVAHGGTRLEIDSAANSAKWPGPGEFRHYAHPIVERSATPIARPNVGSIDPASNPVQITAAWSVSMFYDSSFNNGAGALTLTGSVHAESTPNVLEYNSADGNTLTLQFMKAEPAAGGRSKRLQTFIAQGDQRNPAKLESRTWLNVDHSDKPRIFYIAGPHITYDEQNFEAHVNGAGELLVRDERTDSSLSTGESESQGGFAGKGATSFRWNHRLQMTRSRQNLYDIELLGGVQVIHRAINQAITIVKASELHCTVERSSTASDVPREAAFDLGGTMDLKRLRGVGSVYMDAPNRDVECEQFEYDYGTGIATLDAASGGTVAVVTAGEATPLRASRIVWDMRQDRITISEPTGGAHR